MTPTYPIHAHRSTFIEAVRAHPRILLVGDFGVGKTTIAPLLLLEEGFAQDGLIMIAVPRRLIATTVARRMAEILGEQVGETVGYRIRNEDVTDRERTKIVVATNGVIWRMLDDSPRLEGVSTLLIDEIHERLTDQDFLLHQGREISKARDDFRLLAMSATPDTPRLAAYLGAQVVTVEGYRHPVTITHLPRAPSDMQASIRDAAIDLAGRTSGSMQVFVPDYEAIADTMASLASVRELRPSSAHGYREILPLYGNQPPAEQVRNFSRPGRKILVSSPVSDSGTTPVDTDAGIDTGMRKESGYDPHNCITTLKLVRAARDVCDQRAGRIARTGPGEVARLYTEFDYLKRSPHTTAEILRSDLSQHLLNLLSRGRTFDEVERMDLPTRPGRVTWHAALRTLTLLGATDDNHGITSKGAMMSRIPFPPQYAAVAIAGAKRGVAYWSSLVAASSVTHAPFIRPPGCMAEADRVHAEFADPSSDFLSLCTMVQAWQSAEDQKAFAEAHYLHHEALLIMQEIAERTMTTLASLGLPTGTSFDREAIGRSVAEGFAPVTRLFLADDGRGYVGPGGLRVRIFPGSFVHGNDPQQIVASEIRESSGLYALGVQAVEAHWLDT